MRCFLMRLTLQQIQQQGQGLPGRTLKKKQGSFGHGRLEKVMGFEWLISEPGEVMEMFLRCQKLWI